MSLFVKYVFWFLSTQYVINGLDYCIDRPDIPQKVQGALDGQKLIGKSIKHFGPMGLMECAALCKRQSLCRSINWKQYEDCELNFASQGTFILDYMYIFVDVQYFSTNLAKGCQYVTCPSNNLCVEFETGVNCEVIGCTGVPNVENVNSGAFNERILWEFNEVVTYPCSPLYRPSVNLTCDIGGNWPEFECMPISSCEDVAYCDTTAVSGEYWVYLIPLNEMMKVFCKIEPGLTILSYITLYNNNTATTPIYTRGSDCQQVDAGNYYTTVGTSYFSKVKLRTTTMSLALIETVYIQSDLSDQLFGHAADCFASTPPDICGVIGNFKIDFRGTGFKVRNDTAWESKSSGFVHNITWSYNDSVIVGYCGGEVTGVCGGCKPYQNKLYLDYNQWDVISMSTAKKPVCQYATV